MSPQRLFDLVANANSADFCVLGGFYTLGTLWTNQIARFFKLLYILNHYTVFCNSLHKDRML